MFVLSGRGVLKAVVQKLLLAVAGVDAKKGAGGGGGSGGSGKDKDKKEEDGDHQEVVRAWDLFGAAVVKFVVYYFIAFTVSGGIWPLFRAVGLAGRS